MSANHIALGLRNNGIKTLLKEVVNHYRAGNSRSMIVLPKEHFRGVVRKEEINQNPIIKKLKNFVDINIDEDLNFHVNWTPITIEAKLAEENLEIETIGKGKNFDAIVKLDISELIIKGAKIEFCEFETIDKTCDTKNGLYGRFNNYELRLKDGELIQTLIKTNIRVKDGIVQLDFDRMISNLISQKSKMDKMDMNRFLMVQEAPKFWLNFESFSMPPPVLIMNGTRIELETEEIGNTLLAEREFLANLLTGFAGDFVAQDLVKIVNKKFIKKIQEIRSSFRLIDYNKYEYKNDMFVKMMNNSPEDAIRYLHREENSSSDENFVQTLTRIFRHTIYSAKSNLGFKEMNTKDGQDIIAYFDSDLIVNKKKMIIKKEVWNGKKKFENFTLDNLDFKYDFAFAISEPLINAFSETAMKTGLVNQVFKNFAKMDGVSIDSLKFHIMNVTESCAFDKIKVVANLKVKMSELKRESWWDHISFKLGEYLESDWGGDWNPLPKEQDLFFPVELDFVLSLNRDEDRTYLFLMNDSPFGTLGIRNTFGYPVKDMTGVVKDALYEKLKETLEPHLIESHSIDITDYVKAIPGIEMSPNSLFASKTGHLVFTFKIDDIDFQRLGGKRR
ncbi:MAG: hypothetical protein ACJAS4_001385 [Bacteriovoracaceae bacterium]|jgi:hypothetical protein